MWLCSALYALCFFTMVWWKQRFPFFLQKFLLLKLLVILLYYYKVYRGIHILVPLCRKKSKISYCVFSCIFLFVFPSFFSSPCFPQPLSQALFVLLLSNRWNSHYNDLYFFSSSLTALHGFLNYLSFCLFSVFLLELLAPFWCL